MTKFLNISTDNTLGGSSPSDSTVSSQKAIKEYVDQHGGGGSGSSNIPYGTSSSAADDVEKTVSIPEITTLNVGQIIIVQPSITSVVANSTLKLNDFPAYPMMYAGAAITTKTDSAVWGASFPSIWRFDGTYWVFLAHGLDIDTTYALNNSYDAGQYTAGVGTYAVTRYSILAQKPDMTWEKITTTNVKHTTATTKSVNTSGFLLNQLRYYYATTAVGSGAKIASNTLYEKVGAVDMRYSTNCGNTTTWALGDYIYLVGTIGADGLFYLDTTAWWTNTLPSTNDGKLYIRLGLVSTDSDYIISFFDDRPIFYHDGTGIKEYKVADNKQDVISDLATIRSGASAGATAVQPGDLATVATSGSYNDLSNKPTIPTVGNGTITITQGGVSKGTFTTNQSGNTTIALDAGGGTGDYHPDLFDVKWADHELNDMAWLRGDTFSWQSGSTYSNAYNHLVADIAGKSLTTETIAGKTISFYLADDGHKICPANQESNVFTIVVATGIAWYYILDTANQRFKLPVTEWGFVGLRSAVGKYVEPGLPNITAEFISTNTSGGGLNLSGAAELVGSYSKGAYGGGNGRTDSAGTVAIKASNSSTIYGNSTKVQPAATEMYLYFYVGNFTQTAIENTAGLNAELFNNKADKTFTNTDMIDYVVEKQEPSAANNYTWYRKYKSGWVEQGGKLAASSSAVYAITLPVAMADTSYTAIGTLISNTVSGSGGSFATVYILSSTQINLALDYASTWTGTGCFWVAYGKAA